MIKALMASKKSPLNRKYRQIPLFECLMAILAAVNLGLVLFDMTYISLRNFYFYYIPTFTKDYDLVKGIEPQRDTERYLNLVAQLREQLELGVQNSETINELLQELRDKSEQIIDENPFEIANKSGSLEKIKNRIRDRVLGIEDSAKESFIEFWSQEYLNQKGWVQELEWFDKKIKPLIATNYYRGIGENGLPTDYFGLLELPFTIIFALEFLARTFVISRRHVGVNWIPDAMLWRWYDIFLLIPFWRWLRVITVTIRLNDSNLLDLEPIRVQSSRGFVASFGQELTEVVLLQTINQFQHSIKSGELAKQIFDAQKREYIDLNDINEIEAIASHLIQVTVCSVLPQLKPDIEAILRYNIESFLQEYPTYQQIKKIPGLGNLAEQLAEQLVTEISNLASEGPQNTYDNIKIAMADPVGTKLSNQLVKNFTSILREELQKEHTLEELQSLVVALLEEVKVNYIMNMNQEDLDLIVEESRKLHFQEKNSPKIK